MSNSKWESLKFIPGKNAPGKNRYEYFDKPSSKGTVEYRLLQVDADDNQQKLKTVSVDYNAGDASGFVLYQNYPNPCSDSTVIRYYLPYGCKVMVGIYNDKVQEVEQLINGFQEAGEHQVVFPLKVAGVALPNGVYFYKLKVDNFIDVKKMIVTR
jgi:hypothetical protein